MIVLGGLAMILVALAIGYLVKGAAVVYEDLLCCLFFGGISVCIFGPPFVKMVQWFLSSAY